MEYNKLLLAFFGGATFGVGFIWASRFVQKQRDKKKLIRLKAVGYKTGRAILARNWSDIINAWPKTFSSESPPRIYLDDGSEVTSADQTPEFWNHIKPNEVIYVSPNSGAFQSSQQLLRYDDLEYKQFTDLFLQFVLGLYKRLFERIPIPPADDEKLTEWITKSSSVLLSIYKHSGSLFFGNPITPQNTRVPSTTQDRHPQ
eukprot:TRINITY_DN433_c0_g1_i1.p1 TRINITY_DN433_c0_g1~~TRINITY_DN433_c0_g1_i1.p1  ORF type:complete len:201 (-),score=26.60 TRINITY_DN433_c0_g1_i1:25-627(-)